MFIAITVDGVVFFNPYTSDGKDAVVEEAMGKCNGHSDKQGRYHHHGINNCTFKGTHTQEQNDLGFDSHYWSCVEVSGNFSLTLKVLVATIDAQWEGMGDVGSAR